MKLWWVLRNVFPGPLVRLVFRPALHGASGLPSGGAILVVNHLSRTDPGFLQLAINRQLVFAVNERFFRQPGVTGWLLRSFLLRCESVSVQPGNATAAQSLIDAATATVQAGRLFCVFPEGGISRDGHLHKGHTGLGRVILATGAATIPIAMLNTDDILPPGRWRPKLRRVHIRVGQPIDFDDHGSSSPDDARSVTDRVMREIEELSGRAYVDRYVH